jgi:hypothetical protein
MLALRKSNRYADLILLFSGARVEFGPDAQILTPLAVATLENATAPEQRAQLLSTLWQTVHGVLQQRQLPAAERRWQMEYADIELALNQWETARERYLALYNNAEIEPELFARVALRLGALTTVRPGGGKPGDVLAPVLALAEVPEELKLAAKLLASPDQVRLDELNAKLTALKAPLRLSAAEWDLCRGLRLRLDGNQAQAREVLAAAARNSDFARTWVNSVASQLLRAQWRSPDDELKPDTEKAPERAPQPKQPGAQPQPKPQPQQPEMKPPSQPTPKPETKQANPPPQPPPAKTSSQPTQPTPKLETKQANAPSQPPPPAPKTPPKAP